MVAVSRRDARKKIKLAEMIAFPVSTRANKGGEKDTGLIEIEK
jgi:hypothetical protein